MNAPVRGVFAGLTTLDVVHVLDELPGPDDKGTARYQYVAPGGPAAVAAIAFAALGGAPTLITALGDHPLAWVALAELRGRGVTVVDVIAGSSPLPPVSAVRVHPGTGARSVSSPDAGGIELGDLPALDDLLEGADVVLLDGHHAPLARAVAAGADRLGVPVVVDAGRWRPVFAELLPLATFVVCSAAFTVPDGRDVLATLMSYGVPAVARSNGPSPLRWATVDGEGTVAITPVTGADTLGAGDVLHAAVAFAVAATGGGPALALWPQVLRFATDVATVRVAHRGPQAWLDDPRVAQLARPWTQAGR